MRRRDREMLARIESHLARLKPRVERIVAPAECYKAHCEDHGYKTGGLDRSRAEQVGQLAHAVHAPQESWWPTAYQSCPEEVCAAASRVWRLAESRSVG